MIEMLTSEKAKNLMIKIAAGICLCAALAGGCSYMNAKVGLDDDHAIEEAVEKHLHKQTGIDIDFTPHSKED